MVLFAAFRPSVTECTPLHSPPAVLRYRANMEKTMAIDSKVVAQVAHLARLKVDEADSAALSDRLNDILAMVDQLQQADVTDVAPMAHPLDVTQPLREDEVSEPNVRDKALDIAPAAEDGCFLVPRVIE